MRIEFRVARSTLRRSIDVHRVTPRSSLPAYALAVVPGCLVPAAEALVSAACVVTATPNTAPHLLMVLLTPEAMPESSAATDRITMEATVGNATAIPRPTRISGNSMSAYAEVR